MVLILIYPAGKELITVIPSALDGFVIDFVFIVDNNNPNDTHNATMNLFNGILFLPVICHRVLFYDMLLILAFNTSLCL